MIKGRQRDRYVRRAAAIVATASTVLFASVNARAQSQSTSINIEAVQWYMSNCNQSDQPNAWSNASQFRDWMMV